MDYSICKLVNTAVIIDDSLRACFTSGLKKRFGDQSIKKQNSLLSAMLLDIDANLIDTIKDLFGMMKTVGLFSGSVSNRRNNSKCGNRPNAPNEHNRNYCKDQDFLAVLNNPLRCDFFNLLAFGCLEQPAKFSIPNSMYRYPV